MTAINTPPPLAPGRLQQMSTRIAFFIAGLGIAAWAPLVPYAKARAGLDEGALLGGSRMQYHLRQCLVSIDALIFGRPEVIVTFAPLAGILATRFGCRKVATGGTLLICAALPLLATVSSIPALIATLFMFGAGLGTVDSTVNLQAVIVERASGKNMMSGFHGLFSLGGIVVSQSIRVGGDELDEAIIQYIKKEYSLALGERTALVQRIPVVEGQGAKHRARLRRFGFHNRDADRLPFVDERRVAGELPALPFDDQRFR